MLKDKTDRLFRGSAVKAHLQALMIGDTSGLGDANWTVLNRTGTSHLLVISGLHVGLVAAFAMILCGWMPITLRMLTGCAVVVFYAAIAGLGVSVQRALVMVLVGLVVVAGARVASPAQGFVIALVVVVGVDPVAFLSAGFWLSFLAVAALLTAFAGRVGGGTGWRTYILVAVRAQLAIALVLTPCLVLMKSEASLVAWLVNLLAIPWVSFTVIAPLLAGTLLLPLSETVASWPLAVAEFSLGVLWHALLRASAYAPTLRLATSPLFVTASLLAAMLLLSPYRAGLWLPAIVGWLALAAGIVPERPQEGGFVITVLDVGQGLALLIQTRRHNLVYDTGPGRKGGFDAGRSIVVPALRHLGIRYLHGLIVSHGDADHAGGRPGLVAGYPPGFIHGSAFGELQPCGDERWQWDGVRFHLFGLTVGSDNDRSCVLEVRGAGSALVPGDISVVAEEKILARLGGAVDLLIAPHHGSQSSSGPAFLNALAPAIVIVSAGHKNRFGHPHRTVVDRYERRGAMVITTAEGGAMSWAAGSAKVEAMRRVRRPWHFP